MIAGDIDRTLPTVRVTVKAVLPFRSPVARVCPSLSADDRFRYVSGGSAVPYNSPFGGLRGHEGGPYSRPAGSSSALTGVDWAHEYKSQTFSRSVYHNGPNRSG